MSLPKTGYQEAEQRLREEQATLGRFDAELKSLEEVIKARKATVSNCEIEVEKLDHSVQVLQKETVTAQNRIESYEKQYEWIKHDKQYVNPDLPVLIFTLHFPCCCTVCSANQTHSMILVREIFTRFRHMQPPSRKCRRRIKRR